MGEENSCMEWAEITSRRLIFLFREGARVALRLGNKRFLPVEANFLERYHRYLDTLQKMTDVD